MEKDLGTFLQGYMNQEHVKLLKSCLLSLLPQIKDECITLIDAICIPDTLLGYYSLIIINIIFISKDLL